MSEDANTVTGSADATNMGFVQGNVASNEHKTNADMFSNVSLPDAVTDLVSRVETLEKKTSEYKPFAEPIALAGLPEQGFLEWIIDKYFAKERPEYEAEQRSKQSSE